MDLNKKVVLITGGALGMGRKLSQLLVEENALVSILDIDTKNGEESVASLNSKKGPGTAIFLKCDISNKQEFKESFKKTVEKFGKIDIVVNNAGFWNDSENGWEKMIDVNVKGLIQGSLLALEFMGTENGGAGGVVLNVSSVVGINRMPFIPIYSATKAAVLMFSRCMGDDLHYKKNKVSFLTICPHGSVGGNFFEGLDNKYLYNDDYLDTAFKSVLDVSEFQTIDNVAVAMRDILKKGTNGSVWLVEYGEEAREITVPDFEVQYR